jgi:acyl-CoA dehydrogenase
MDGQRRLWETEELTLMRDSVARFLEKELLPERERWDEEGVTDKESWRKLGEAGLLCTSIPEEYGGIGGTHAHDIVVMEEMARLGLDGIAGCFTIHSCIVPHYLLHYASEEQKRKWLPKLASGATIAAIAMSEPGTGSDLQAITTGAKRDGDHYVINGSKIFTSNGQNAELIVIVCRTGGAGAKGVSLIVLETDDPMQAKGFRRGRNLNKIGMASQDTSELFFDGVRVPVENLIGAAEGQGFVQLMVQLGWERLQGAVLTAINMEVAVKMTTAYTRERRAFGKAIFDFQNTQFKLAECATTAKVARMFVDQCIVQLLDGKLDPVTAAMAKYWTTEQVGKVVDECLQLFGGYGYMKEYPIARLYTDVRLFRIVAGTNEIMKTIIARSL